MFLRQPYFALVQNHLVTYPTPANLTYFWGFGSLSGILLASQIVTGIFLAMHYTPHVDLAFASIEHIMRDVNSGWFLRYLHANGASFFFFLVYIHIGRTVYFGFYHNPRKYLWLSGIGIFFLMMAIAFMGYVLPWGQMSFWGATVITNLFTAIPVVGESVAYWLWGGFSVSNATLTRFFSLHYCLPFILISIVGLHLVLLHRDGSQNPLGVATYSDKIAFYPYFYVKDYFGLVVFATVGFAIITYSPDLLGHPDNYIEANALVTPAHIVPEWYFLPFYAILRAVPNKLGGVILMGLAIAILIVLPFYKTVFRSQFIGGRPFYLFSFWIFALAVIFLGFLGGAPIEEPYTVLAQILALYYFLFFVYFIVLDYLLMQFIYSRNLVAGDSAHSILSAGLFVPVKHIPNHFILEHRYFYFLKKSFRNLTSTNLLLAKWLTNALNAVDMNHQTRKQAYLKRLEGQGRKQFFSLFSAKHSYHLVNPSPWPFIVSLSLMGITFGAVLYMHQFLLGSTTLSLGLVSLLVAMGCWFRDIIREGTFEGHHTALVQKGLKVGMILFIVSEVMFFFSFFWGFFHSSLAPAVQIGGIWPPKGILVFNPWEVPLLNTLILLTSGASVTWAHYAVRSRFARWLTKDALPVDLPVQFFSRNYFLGTQLGVSSVSRTAWQRSATLDEVLRVINTVLPHSSQLVAAYRGNLPSQPVAASSWAMRNASVLKRSRHEMLVALLVTIFLGLVFTVIQFFEYKHAAFTLSDSVYGSTFFLTTGFHGLHVIIGTLLLIVCFFRGSLYHFTRTHHVGLESAIWYWHFVDVVWLGLYISIYHWGGAF